MDHFGIGSAMTAMVRVYAQSARHTGRTTSLLESLRDGDVVVSYPQSAAKDLRLKLRERGLKVEVFVLDPAFEPIESALAMKGTPQGRLLFDHGFVERVYERAIERTAENIDHWQRQFGGYGTAHVETRQAYIEKSKWR